MTKTSMTIGFVAGAASLWALLGLMCLMGQRSDEQNALDTFALSSHLSRTANLVIETIISGMIGIPFSACYTYLFTGNDEAQEPLNPKRPGAQ